MIRLFILCNLRPAVSESVPVAVTGLLLAAQSLWRPDWVIPTHVSTIRWGDLPRRLLGLRSLATQSPSLERERERRRDDGVADDRDKPRTVLYYRSWFIQASASVPITVLIHTHNHKYVTVDCSMGMTCACSVCARSTCKVRMTSWSVLGIVTDIRRWGGHGASFKNPGTRFPEAPLSTS